MEHLERLKAMLNSEIGLQNILVDYVLHHISETQGIRCSKRRIAILTFTLIAVVYGGDE
jgi:hypothetical protein